MMLQQPDERICSRFPSSTIDGPSGLRSAPSSPSRKVVNGTHNKPPTATDIGKKVLFYTQVDKKERSGRLRYFGSPEFAPGIWCGIELDEPVGKNNGSVSGIRYFSCPSNHGLFVPLGRVELDPTKTKPRKSSRFKAVEPPFFYNTLPRYSSIPNALQDIGLPRSSTLKSPLRMSPMTGDTRGRVGSLQVTTPTTKKSLGGFNKETPKIRVNSISSSSLVGSKKKFASELNIARKSKSTAESPLVAVVAPQKRFRKTLASCSNDFSGPSSNVSNKQDSGESSLRSFSSCSNLNQATMGTNTLRPNRGTSPNDIRGTSPNGVRGTSPNGVRGTSPNGVRDTSPNGVRGTSPSSVRSTSPVTPYDSEVDSFCSSTSDLSRHSTSDSDPTPRSSSASPDLDSAFILTTPSSPAINILSSPEASPVHKAPGLSTVATNLVESSRSNGMIGEYRGPSPEGPNSHRKFQNHQGGCTLEHPLVNGKSAHKKSEDNGIYELENGYNLHGDDDRLNAISSQLDSCLNQYALMDGRVGDVELTLISFKKDVLSMLEEIKGSFQSQVDTLKEIHQQQLKELTRRHKEELKEVLQTAGNCSSHHNS